VVFKAHRLKLDNGSTVLRFVQYRVRDAVCGLFAVTSGRGGWYNIESGEHT
jgi:hypothetical protein